jgi:uncharacterized cupin superfamily protein
MGRPVINLDDLEYSRTMGHGELFEAELAAVGPLIGAFKLGYNVTRVPPGKRAFPLHNHHANEEAFFILEGEGTLRFGHETYPVRKGDFISCPAGGPEVAHQLINTGGSQLLYLGLSTTLDTEVVQYPDSGKVAVVAGRLPGMRMQEAPFVGIYEEGRRLGYWDGE